MIRKGRFLVFHVITFAALFACQNNPFVFQEDGSVGATDREETIDIPTQTDILFVVDNSQSMIDEIQTLKQEVLVFVEELSKTPNKFRIGLISTDNFPDSADPTTACDQNIAGTKGTNHGRCGHLLAPDNFPAYLQKEDFNTPTEFRDTFSQYLDQLSASGTPYEQHFRSVSLALDPQNRSSGQPNEGFFRDDALLLIIFMTDEADCSFKDNLISTFTSDKGTQQTGFNCYGKKDQLNPVSDWVNDIVARKSGNKNLVSVGLISAANKETDGNLKAVSCNYNSATNISTNQCHCLYFGAQAYCDATSSAVTYSSTLDAINPQRAGGICTDASKCCTALANERLFEFSSNFRSYKDTICKKSYSDTLLQFAKLADRQCFPLQRAPLDNDASNIQIKLKRAAQKDFTILPQTDAANPQDGWYYNSHPSPEACLNGIYKIKNGDTIKLFVVDKKTGQNL